MFSSRNDRRSSHFSLGPRGVQRSPKTPRYERGPNCDFCGWPSASLPIRPAVGFESMGSSTSPRELAECVHSILCTIRNLGRLEQLCGRRTRGGYACICVRNQRLTLCLSLCSLSPALFFLSSIYSQRCRMPDWCPTVREHVFTVARVRSNVTGQCPAGIAPIMKRNAAIHRRREANESSPGCGTRLKIVWQEWRL